MNRLLTATLALSFFPVLIGTPSNPATAGSAELVAQARRNSGPVIDSFQVQQVNSLAPGNQLIFTLRGTRGARVTMNIGNIARNVPMREVRPGYYEARYTIRQGDRITENTPARANLQLGNRRVNAGLENSLVAGNYGDNGNYGYNNNSYDTGSLYIENFSLRPVDSLQPGNELVFSLTGTPNARATYSIDGIAYDQPLREVSPGRYEGRYVIRRQDVLSNSNMTAIATLADGDRVVRTRLEQTLNSYNTYNDNYRELPLTIYSPSNNSQVSDLVEIRGRSAPNATVTVNVVAKNNLLGLFGYNQNVYSRTLQTDSNGDFQFSFRPASNIVPGTRYEVSLNAAMGDRTRQETLVLVQR